MAGKEELSASQVRAITAPGKHRVAPNLFLFISERRRSWMFRGKLNGREVWRGLGTPQIVPLREARAAALEMRLEIHKGALPSRRRREQACPSFAELAEKYIATHEKGWRDPRAARTWRNTLAQHASKLSKLPVDVIEARDVAAALKAVWTGSPSTAIKVRGRVAAILDYARALGHRHGDNPAKWDGQLSHLLPPLSTEVKHHDAVPVAEIPAFAAELMSRKSISSKALLFTLLCACRTGDTIGARWSEIDLDAKLWSIPEGRTKSKRAFRVPLSDAALAVLADLPRDGEYVFALRGRALKNMAMLKLMKAIRGPRSTVHGLRSSFRDWGSEDGKHRDEVVELALDHRSGNATYNAYARSDLLEARRSLMQDWAEYVDSHWLS